MTRTVCNGRLSCVGVLLATMTACGGCSWSASPPIQPGGGRVALMSESEFDAFADRIARGIPAAFSDPGVGMPPALSLPAVSVERLNEQQAASDFARALVAGLNDRLGGKTTFDQTLESARGPRSSIAFTDAEGGTNPDRRVATFTITDASGERELLRESVEFEPVSERSRAPAPPPRQAPPKQPSPPVDPREPKPASAPPAPPAPAPRAGATDPARAPRGASAAPGPGAPHPPADLGGPPAKSAGPGPTSNAPAEPAKSSKPVKLKLSLKGNELIEAIRNRSEAYDAWTQTGGGGNLVFLDAKTAERFWVRRIRGTRTSDDRLQVEIEIRARDKSRDADYRFVFYDDAENAISSTAVIETEFHAHRWQTISITAGDRRATQWVCLFEED